ncbi:MAG: dipeptidase, partial [Actinobacteria bacterium]|nr:dipeptidase [Actinomycetota bacterium]
MDSRVDAFPDDSIDSYLQSCASGLLGELSALVAIPSVSWPSFDAQRVHESAAMTRQLIQDTGLFSDVAIVRASMGAGEELG